MNLVWLPTILIEETIFFQLIPRVSLGSSAFFMPLYIFFCYFHMQTIGKLNFKNVHIFPLDGIFFQTALDISGMITVFNNHIITALLRAVLSAPIQHRGTEAARKLWQ